MSQIPPELLAHREWLGQIQPVGLVVSPAVLVRQGVFVDRQKGIEKQARLREIFDSSVDFAIFARDVLEWPDGLLAGSPGGPDLPDALTIALPEYDDRLSPTYAVPNPDPVPAPAPVGQGFSPADNWLALVSIVPNDVDLDRLPADHTGWRATPHARLERLLRETGVPVGLLFNGASLRLVYAPRGESSGHLTFRFAHLVETLGRPMASALYALLGVVRVTDLSPEDQRLPALLHESRKYQNEVSTELAGQVLEALWELLRGFQRADDDSKGELLRGALRDDPHEVYGGLLSTLMRLVFILYAEDRGLMPQSEVYQRHYSVSGLFERLREDQARYPDTMDARYGAWAHLLALFRLIHDGAGHGDLRVPARHGRLFNPDASPFLEGRPPGSARQLGEVLEAPQVPDGTVFRVLQNLLVLGGERLSYRALDVEQIGSVYEAMMGFALEVAKAPSIAVTPKHIVINLEDLLEQKGKDRASWLREHAELKVTSDAIGKAATIPDLVAALGSRVSRYTPHALKTGAIYLQPTEERRRSGSHYTPRSLTEPIVRTTFRPILERLGEQATPEQILDLKVCDPAMGSGAFLVEACRLLGERLVRAWEIHKRMPKVPDDEDALTYARRLVAERCLYGVDKNIFAVDLAKLSLWLATLARDHPFTFLDHAVRHGDSLVGLAREQIACLHWNPGKQLPLIRTFLDARVAEAQRLREQIQGMGASDDVPEKVRLLKDAEEAIDDVRLVGDAVVSAFFEREKPKDRETLRVAYAGKIENYLSERKASVGQGFSLAGPAVASVGQGFSPANGLRTNPALDLRAVRASLREGDRPIPAFYWEVEFPEVFTRNSPGFDAFIGNPPFLGGKRTSTVLGDRYKDWLTSGFPETNNNADLVSFFFRRAFDLLASEGAFGLVATNTIAQGDTRRAGLLAIRRRGGTIYAVTKRLRWPGKAAVVVSIVHTAKGPYAGTRVLDGVQVPKLTAFLFDKGGDDDPFPINAHPKVSFVGCDIKGQGLTFDDEDPQANTLDLKDRLILQDPKNAEIISPYMGGEEINTDPQQRPHRYVIDFGTRSEAEAANWPALLAIARERVLPDRLKKGEVSKCPYWQFWRPRPDLRRAKASLNRVIACSQTSKYRVFAFVETSIVLGHKAIVIASQSEAMFACVSCRAHEEWAGFFGSTMKDDPVYTPSDCFDTFPFPGGLESNGSSSAFAQAGCDYYEFRSALMVRNNEGLTQTYNRFHDPNELDPDILKLRELHDAMDCAVLDAYGWSDIQPTCDFILDYADDEDDTPGKASKRRKPWRYRWPDDIRDEVLGRLLELNAQRAREEALAGAAANHGAGPKRRKAREAPPMGDGSVFGKSGRTPLLD
jgi:hypothetical protein